MRKIGDIHVFEDEAFLRSMRRASGAVALAGVAAAVLWGLAMTALHDALGAPVVPFELGAAFGSLGNRIMGADGGQGFKIWWWILLAAVPVASLGVHELVHAFFFRQYAPPGARVAFGANAGMGMLYASAEGVRYTRGQYLVIALAPSVVVSLLLIAVGMGLRWPLWTFIVVTAHLVGCTGDWGYARAILADPAIEYCEDTSYGVAFYGEDDLARGGLAGRSLVSGSVADGGLANCHAAATPAVPAESAATPTAPAASDRNDAAARKKRGFTVVEGGRRS